MFSPFFSIEKHVPFGKLRAGSERNRMDCLLKEFLFLGTISVTDSEVIAFYMRAEA